MSIRTVELDWYRKHGKHKAKRIVKDANNKEYVIGDFSWNRSPANKKRQEFCEPEMSMGL